MGSPTTFCTYKETCKRGHKSFFCQFPNTTILLFINRLEGCEVNIQNTSICQCKSKINQSISTYITTTFHLNPNTHSARPINPCNENTPQIRPNITAIICRAQ